MRASYSEAERARGMRAMVVEGVFTRSMESVTGGVVLAGFALALGAGDVVIGLLAALPFLAQIMHIPAAVLLTRFPDRRRVVVTAQTVARSLFVAVAAIALAPPEAPRVALLVGVMAAYALVSTVAGAAWQVWIREIVPRDIIGSYFGRRHGLLSLVALVAVLLAGQVLTRAGAPVPLRTYAALFIAGTVIGWVGAFVTSRAPSAEAPAPSRQESVRSLLARPFKNRDHRRLLTFLGTWGFAANLALPFVSVVLIVGFGFDFSVVTGLAALSLAANAGGFWLWSRFPDRFGHKPVLYLCASAFVVAMVVWAALPDEPTRFTLAAVALLHVALGVTTAGLDLASGGLVMKLAPDDEAPAYLASASAVRAVTTGVAPVIAGVAAALLADRQFALRLTWSHPGGAGDVTALAFAHYDFLFLAAGVIGLYAVHRLLGFEEHGEASPDVVARAVRRDIQHMSSIAGLRAFAHVAGYAVETVFKFDRKRPAPKPRAAAKQPRRKRA